MNKNCLFLIIVLAFLLVIITCKRREYFSGLVDQGLQMEEIIQNDYYQYIISHPDTELQLISITYPDNLLTNIENYIHFEQSDLRPDINIKFKLDNDKYVIDDYNINKNKSDDVWEELLTDTDIEFSGENLVSTENNGKDSVFKTFYNVAKNTVNKFKNNNDNTGTDEPINDKTEYEASLTIESKTYGGSYYKYILKDNNTEYEISTNTSLDYTYDNFIIFAKNNTPLKFEQAGSESDSDITITFKYDNDKYVVDSFSLETNVDSIWNDILNNKQVILLENEDTSQQTTTQPTTQPTTQTTTQTTYPVRTETTTQPTTTQPTTQTTTQQITTQEKQGDTTNIDSTLTIESEYYSNYFRYVITDTLTGDKILTDFNDKYTVNNLYNIAKYGTEIKFEQSGIKPDIYLRFDFDDEYFSIDNVRFIDEEDDYWEDLLTNSMIVLVEESTTTSTEKYGDYTEDYSDAEKDIYEGSVEYEYTEGEYSGIYKCLDECDGNCLEYGITGKAWCFEN